MHFMPDTEDLDSAAETFWPGGYKQVIREDVRQSVGDKIGDGKLFILDLEQVIRIRTGETDQDAL